MQESFGRVVRRHMYLMPLCLALGLVGFPWTTCSGGSPLWLYALYMPVLGLSKYAERPGFGGELHLFGWNMMEILGFFHVFPWFSPLETEVQADRGLSGQPGRGERQR